MAASKAEIKQFERRKAEHIELALDDRNQTEHLSNLADIKLQHEALPDFDFSEINIQSQCLQKTVPTPFFVSSMTAGHVGGNRINRTLALACETRGWAMGVGSQRRQLDDENAYVEWVKLRELAPNVTLFGNIGLAQIIHTPVIAIQRLVDSIAAAGMIVHLNPLQECLQPEGTPNFKGGEAAIARLTQELSVPVIIKETGCGFSPATLKRLLQHPLGAIDVSGLGGTHWGRIEGQRSHQNKRHHASQTFKDWGIPTLTALKSAMQQAPACDVWASGGIRTGLDAAKCLALGANMVGFAKPMLEVALDSLDATRNAMETLEYELKIALFCTGSPNLIALGDKLCR